MNINVELLQHSPLEILIRAIRTCYNSHNKSDSSWCVSKDLKYYNTKYFEVGPKDIELINRIIESKHDSTLEHIVFTFEITGISRLCLQELARHRMASYSVKSTRYTLKELKNEAPFKQDWEPLSENNMKRAEKYVNFIGVKEIDQHSVFELEFVRSLINKSDISNDKIKYNLPESYKVDLVMTINLRSLRNFLNLRKANEAHFEIRTLAETIEEIIPKEYHFLLS